MTIDISLPSVNEQVELLKKELSIYSNYTFNWIEQFEEETPKLGICITDESVTIIISRLVKELIKECDKRNTKTVNILTVTNNLKDIFDNKGAGNYIFLWENNGKSTLLGFITVNFDN